MALEAEFNQLAIDLDQRIIAVQTDPIELEGVFLGDFSIRLHWHEDVSKRPGYRIVPLAEHESRSQSEVCHPHVSSNTLCEGDASGPIRRALQDLRLFDFFLVVSRVLDSYNSHSAYVSLEDWESWSCEGCGDLVDAEETTSCHCCHESLCRGCLESCCHCDDGFCGCCLNECQECGSKICQTCTTACRACDRELCNDCLIGETCDECEAKGELESVEATDNESVNETQMEA